MIILCFSKGDPYRGPSRYFVVSVLFWRTLVSACWHLLATLVRTFMWTRTHWGALNTRFSWRHTPAEQKHHLFSLESRRICWVQVLFALRKKLGPLLFIRIHTHFAALISWRSVWCAGLSGVQVCPGSRNSTQTVELGKDKMVRSCLYLHLSLSSTLHVS